MKIASRISSRRFAAAALTGLALLVSACLVPSVSMAQVGGTSAIPPEYIEFASDWPMANHDYANTRATTSSSINSTNVNTLGVAWAFPIASSGTVFGAAASTPVIQGNTVYFQDLALNTYALDLTSGSLLWQKLYNTPTIGPNGPAVAYGKVFVQSDLYSYSALDAITGEELWKEKISTNAGIGIDIAPAVYDSRILVSTVPGISIQSFYTGGVYGTFYALDQSSGAQLWKWDTIDDPASMWGNPRVNSGGGAWFPPAVDNATGVTYWSVANPAPFPGTPEFPNGSSRPGPNLYTNSLAAISADGAVLWITQVLPHDLTDHDLQLSPILAQATVSGKLQDVVITGGKMGQVYCMNRETGAILWQTMVGKHQNDLLIDHGVTGNVTSAIVFPSSLGGIETPMAYSDNVVYVAVNNLGGNWTATSSVNLPASSATGNLVAIDVNFGRWLWSIDLPAGTYGGATVVNDLVFTATQDGTIYAFNKYTGEKVWTYKAPAGIIAWPAVAGDYIVWPCGTGGTPTLLAFKLGAASPVLEIARPTAGSAVASGNVTALTGVFNFNLVNKMGQAAVPGEGHLHYFLDFDAPTTQGQPAVPPAGTNVIWAQSANTTYTFANVTAGNHFISVEVVNNDHTPLSPPVVAKVFFKAVDSVPSVRITSPVSELTTHTGPISVNVTLANFALTAGNVTTNVPNQGKLILYNNESVPRVPGQLATTANSTVLSTTTGQVNLVDGVNVITAQLANNDLTVLDIPAIAQVYLFVNVYGRVTGP